MTGAPNYMPNNQLHRELKIPLVKDEIYRLAYRYKDRLESHCNNLASGLASITNRVGLRRNKFSINY